MRRCRTPLAALALLAVACPPLGDDYEIVEPKSDAGMGGTSGTGGDSSTTGGSSGTGGGGSGGTAAVGGTSTGGAGAGGSDAGDAAADADCSTCDATCCGGSCVDLQTSTEHCGACANACPKGRACNFGKCAAGWVAMASSTFAAREKMASTWSGSRVFLFGGADATGTALGDAALYDPIGDTWTAVASASGAPSPRVLATAIDVGGAVLVFGGGDVANTADYKDGALYALGPGTWSKIPDAPKERRAPLAARKGNQIVVWGGWDKADKPVPETHIFDLLSKSWSVVTNSNEPSPRTEVAWSASNDHLYISGGRVGGTTKIDEAFRAALDTGVWAATGKGVSARWGSFGAWDGSRFWVWGGRDDNNPKADGSLYDGSAWSALPATGVPTARWAPQRHTGWAARVTDKVVILAGGMNTTGTYFTNGAVYDGSAATPKWTAVADWPSAQHHAWGAGVWTGQELVLWGGRTGTALTSKGERYLP